MLGRTNAVGGGVTGAENGVTTLDLPTCPQRISAKANSSAVTICLEYSDTEHISGVDVVVNSDHFPTSPTDGEITTASGAASEIKVGELTNGQKYYFRVYLFREEGGIKFFQTDDTNAIISQTPTAIAINGVSPAICGDNFLVIDSSAAFTLEIPENLTVTAHIVGGGSDGEDGDWDWPEEDGDAIMEQGKGGQGGYYLSGVVADKGTVSCVCTVGAAYDGFHDIGKDDDVEYEPPTHSTLVIGSQTLNTQKGTCRNSSSGDGEDGWHTPYGWIGSSGGAGKASRTNGFAGGRGAGDGGYADKGYSSSYKPAIKVNGSDAENYGCGGGGGGADNYHTYVSAGGKGKQGAIIICWE